MLSTLRLPKKIAQFSSPKRFGTEKYPVYLGSLELVSSPQTLEKKSQQPWNGFVSTRLVFQSKRMLPVARMDVLPTTQKSFVIYEYKCHCDNIGRTSQRLQDCIIQHVPQWLRQQLTRPRRSLPHRSCKRNDTKMDCDSASGQYLFENGQCALNHDNKRFSILATARSFFHLNLLEAAYLKTQRPVLCRQKEFVYTLHSQTLDNRGVPIWLLAVLALTFRYCEISFFGALFNASTIVGLS